MLALAVISQLLPFLCLQQGADLLLAAVDYLLQNPGAQDARVAVLHNAAAPSPPSEISQLVHAALQLPSRRSKLPGGPGGTYVGPTHGHSFSCFPARCRWHACSAMPWSILPSTAFQKGEGVTSVACGPAARSDQRCPPAACACGAAWIVCSWDHTVGLCSRHLLDTPVVLDGCQHNVSCSTSLQLIPCHVLPLTVEIH